MSWTCLIFSFVVGFALISYAVRTRHTYRPPVEATRPEEEVDSYEMTPEASVQKEKL